MGVGGGTQPGILSRAQTGRFCFLQLRGKMNANIPTMCKDLTVNYPHIPRMCGSCSETLRKRYNNNNNKIMGVGMEGGALTNTCPGPENICRRHCSLSKKV